MNTTKEQSIDELAKAIALCQTEGEIKAFLADLCTPQERDAMAERWQIAQILSKEELSYRAISALTGASTTTIGRVSRFLKQERHRGYQTILDRL
jgi:TrpR-related protein YerC/YecD